MLYLVYKEIEEPDDFPLEEEKLKIAEFILNKYKAEREELGDLELELLSEINCKTVEGRFEMVFLAILFIRKAAAMLKATDSRMIAIAGFMIWMLVGDRAKNQTSSSLKEAATSPINGSMLGFL